MEQLPTLLVFLFYKPSVYILDEKQGNDKAATTDPTPKAYGYHAEGMTIVEERFRRMKGSQSTAILDLSKS